MSTYTTEVRYICEATARLDESVGGDDVGQVIHASHASVIGDYPIFDEEYREILNTKILKHYYTREIGFETVGLWKLKLNTKMNEIMPYYNQLYESVGLIEDPFKEVDYTIDHSGTKNGVASAGLHEDSKEKASGENGSVDSVSEKQSGNTSGVNSSSRNVEGHGKNRFSETPQGTLSNIENNTYLTNATLDDTNSNERQNGNSSNSSDSERRYARNGLNTMDTTGERSTKRREFRNDNTTDEYIRKVAGKTSAKSYASLLNEWRKTFMNIDMMIIAELSDLFMGVW